MKIPKIMIVEDEGIVAEDLKTSLIKLGYEVIGIAASGEEAIEIIKNNPADLVLMDIMLQGNMNGIEAADIIRLNYQVPVIYVTSYADDNTLEKAKITQPISYILKPFEEKELHSIIELALYKSEIDKKIKENEVWLSTILKSIGDAVIVTDQSTVIKFMNPLSEQLTGWNLDEAYGKELKEILKVIDEYSRLPVENPAEKVIIEGIVFNITNHLILISRDGKETPIDESGAPIFDFQGSIIGTVLIFRDITSRRKSDLALRLSEKRFRTLVEKLPDGVFRCTPKGIIIEANSAMTKILGVDKLENLLGLSIYDFIFIDSKVDNNLIMEKYFEGIKEFQMIKKDFTIIWVENHCQKIINEENQFVYYEGIIRDISERVKNREEMLQIQKIESIGLLAGGIAHDFNNLLQVIIGQISIALSETDPEQRSYTRILKAQKASLRASELTQQLLAYSGQGQFKTVIFNLNTLITENINILEASITKNITLITNLSEDIGLIVADKNHVQQIIMNLIINSSEAISDKLGIISISTRNEFINGNNKDWTGFFDIDISSGEYVILDITDNGSGISDEILPKIFDPFFSTKKSGRGLGLAALLGIIKSNKCGIKVESKLQSGTTFKIAFPKLIKQDSNQISESKEDKKSILIIDDEISVLDTLSDILNHFGFNVYTAYDGETGLELFKVKFDEIDLIILDLTMPGIGGEETYRRIKEINPDIKIILASGYTDYKIANLIKDDMFTSFIQKPFTPQLLINLINKFLK